MISDLPIARALAVIRTTNEILEAFDAGSWKEALYIWITCDLDNDERVAVWGFIEDSKQRAFLNDRQDRKYLQEFWE